VLVDIEEEVIHAVWLFILDHFRTCKPWL